MHPHLLRFYNMFNLSIQANSVLKVKSILFYSLFRYSRPWIASWQNAGPETNHKRLEDYIAYRCQYYYKCIFRLKT